MGGGSSTTAGKPGVAKPKLVSMHFHLSDNRHRTFICRFCGGKTCKREDYKKQPEGNAIHGLHSSWITENILAMQRPSSRLIKEFELIKAFQINGIQAVVNLQNNGEHPLCGDGIHPEGFSYLPEEFMDKKIFYNNFGWVDMGVPSMSVMLAIVKTIDMHIKDQKVKVAVHCHAGYGRTGIVIACWMVFSLSLTAEDAIKHVRGRRKGCVQTSKQQKFVHKFAEHLQEMRRVFPLSGLTFATHVESASFLSGGLGKVLQNQSQFMNGSERLRYRKVPKVVDVICSKLIEVAKKDAHQVAFAFINLPDWFDIQGDKELLKLKDQLNHENWGALDGVSVRFLCQLLLDWLDCLDEPIFQENVSKIISENHPSGEFTSVVQECVVHINQSKVARSTLEFLVHLLRMFATLEGCLQDIVYKRFAYALMHPKLSLPFPLPFRTLRLFVTYDDSQFHHFVKPEDYSTNFLDPNPQSPTPQLLTPLGGEFYAYEVIESLGQFIRLFVRAWGANVVKPPPEAPAEVKPAFCRTPSLLPPKNASSPGVRMRRSKTKSSPGSRLLPVSPSSN